MAEIRQVSFAAGELAPTLYGRSDIEQYAHGLRRCRNFTIGKAGEAKSRPGMLYLGAAASHSFASRLVPFLASGDTAYVLEFGNGSLRVWWDGAVLSINGGSTSITTQWNNTEIFELKFVQVGDVLTICHKSDVPYELTRTAHTTWTLAAVSFGLNAFTIPDPGLLEPLPTADTDHPEREWVYKVTTVEQDADGLIWESEPYTITDSTTGGASPGRVDTPLPDNKIAVYSDQEAFFVTIDWNAGSWQSTGNLLGVRIYKGRGRIFGFIGEATAAEASAPAQFVDDGIEPDYTLPPPEGRNPFIVYDTDGSELRTERPLVVSYFEQRAVYAAMAVDDTVYRPGTIIFSKTNDLTNFDKKILSSLNVATDPIEITLAARRREQIRALLPLDRLLVFTDQSVWVVGGEGALSPVDLVPARRQGEVGIAEKVDPIVVEGSVLFVRSKGTGVRELAYSNERGAFAGGNLSFLAQHFFDGYQITDLCYAEDPDGLVWAVRDDGALLSLTYGSGQAAWALHTTDGVVESICSIPAETEDQVWMCVRRTIAGQTKRYIERFASRVFDDVADAVCLDSAVTQSAPGSTTIAGLGHLADRAVYAVADGVVIGPKTVNAGQIDLNVELDGTAPTTVHVGIRYDCDLDLLDAPVARERQKKITQVVWEVEGSDGLFTGEELPAAGTTTNLYEWEQRDVQDGWSAIGLATGRADVRIASGFNTHGRACLRQFDPLPLTVVGVTRVVE